MKDGISWSRIAIPLLAGLAACSDITTPRPLSAPLLTVNRVSVDTTQSGAILLDVSAPAFATIRVTYWCDDAAPLMVTAVEQQSVTRVSLPRLEAGERYRYSTVAVNVAGVPGPASEGEFATLPLPDDLAQVQFTASGAPTEPLAMLEVNGHFRGLVAVDGAGRPVWWFRTQGSPQGVARRANGNFVLDDNRSALVEITPGGDVVHTLPLSGGGPVGGWSHHDVLVTPANTVLFLAQDTRAVGDSTLTGDAIWEWNPESGALARRFSTFDAFDPSLDVGTHSIRTDWLHANSLAYGDHGNVILSLNWIDQVVSIAPDFASLEWRLGGRGSTIAVDADASFQGQHTAQLLPNGHVLMFDDERDRGAALGYSRALELSLEGGKARRVWSYRATPDIYTPYMGSARRLPNGNSLVHFSMPAGMSGATGPVSTQEVTPGGTVVWRLVATNLGGVGAIYRATPMESIADEVLVR